MKASKQFFWPIMVGLVLGTFTLPVASQEALAIIGDRPPAPSDKPVPYRKSFKCFGKWVKVKRQIINSDGYSVPHVGYKCVDDPKLRKQMVEGGN